MPYQVTLWYRVGTVSVAQGATTVSGEGTLFTAADILPGDIFTVDGIRIYEVSEVVDDFSFELREPYEGVDVNDGEYAIIRNVSHNTNSRLAARINALVARWAAREDEYAEWQGGDADGGPNGDGRYPLTSPDEETVRLVLCPAALEATLAGLTNIEDFEQYLQDVIDGADRADAAAARAEALSDAIVASLGTPAERASFVPVWDETGDRLTYADGVTVADLQKLAALPAFPCHPGDGTYVLHPVTDGEGCTLEWRKLRHQDAFVEAGDELTKIYVDDAVFADASAVFTIRGEGEVGHESTVEFRTGPDTAKPGEDYEHQAGTLVFAEGETQRTVTVPLVYDEDTPSGRFYVVLCHVTAAVIWDGLGVADMGGGIGGTLVDGYVGVSDNPRLLQVTGLDTVSLSTFEQEAQFDATGGRYLYFAWPTSLEGENATFIYSGFKTTFGHDDGSSFQFNTPAVAEIDGVQHFIWRSENKVHGESILVEVRNG